MFVRRKKNKSGTVSIVVVDKRGGKFKELHTVGIAHDEDEITSLCAKGKQWIDNHMGQQTIDLTILREKTKRSRLLRLC